jgi:hypothetical protein
LELFVEPAAAVQLGVCTALLAHLLPQEMRMGIISATMGVLLMKADANMIGTIMRTCSTSNQQHLVKQAVKHLVADASRHSCCQLCFLNSKSAAGCSI